MSEAANVRLVRCPKCENLLPELTDYSVYQCGGCGAVLTAKNKGVDLDAFSDKSDEQRISDRHENATKVSDRRMMDTSDGSESDVRSTVSSSSRAGTRRTISRYRGESRRTVATRKEEKLDIVEADVIIKDKGPDELQRAKLVQSFENSEMYHETENSEGTRHRKEGQSHFMPRPGYDSENPARNNVNYIGDDRAELLKQLDELKDQLSRSGNLIDKGKEKVLHNQRMSYGSDNSYSDASSEMNRVLMRNSFEDPQNRRPLYWNQYPEPPPLMRRQEMGSNGFYPPRYAPMPYHVTPSYGYESGPYMDDGRMMYMDDRETYPPNFSRHHPSCSCYQCRNKRQVPNDRVFGYHDNPNQYGSHDYNRRFSEPYPLKSCNAQLHGRWPSDVNSEVDGYIRRRPLRARLDSGRKKCRPIAGGAPFLTCYNCLELLLLPKNVVMNDDNKKKKMSCGACSTVIVFTVSYNKLVVSFDIETEDDYVKVNKSNQVRTTFSSDDYDNSGYDLCSNKSNETKNRRSTSSYISEVEEDNDVSKDKKGPRPPAGSSLQDHFEYSNKYHMANRSGEGNRSGRSEKDKAISNKNANNKQVSRNESSATEIDLSSNEYSNTGTTFDSGEGSREGDHLKASRAAKSVLGGVGFNDSNRSNESLELEKANVTVNGHLITDRLIRKAEKLAGPIHPGNYWYDFRAGFWGAMGGPCLGIIPPFIEEFNYPMPEHCAGGNTHVFVNGRELNQKDLNLLGSRGLPLERDRSYIVEISGRVLDEDTGEELESLGKLAPTVERVKHGFGMRTPKAAS